MEQVLKALISGPNGPLALPAIVDFLKKECLKKSIAVANAFVLVDWCSVLLLQFATAPDLWSKYGLDVALSLSRLLETCMAAGDSRRAARIQSSALVASRRALRALFRSAETREDALAKLVVSLTTKGSSSTAGNAVLLGVVAGVSSRLDDAKPLLNRHKQHYYAFYVREIVGSRSQLPDHISNAFHDFFDSFPTLDELRKEVIPAFEKALLRAPEVVLNNVVSPMVLALPEEIDLSEVLLGNLLKPLLSNVKSTNPAIRAGALRTFQALSSRSTNTATISKIADEILGPLKQGKVSGVDQKVLHAQMLLALPESVPLSEKIPVSIVPVALKEPNEPAVVAEVSALTKHLTFGLSNGLALDKAVSDAFIKGMADKRIPIRRLWAIRAADLWWNLSSDEIVKPDIMSFCQATLPKLMEMWQDVIANPIPATQTGMVTVGHFVTALLLEKVRTVDDPKLTAIYKKSDVVSQLLTVKPRPSFLLNPRVYSKLSSDDDISIAMRALTAIAPSICGDSVSAEAREAWAHAFIFFIVAHGISPKAKSAAKQALTKTYTQAPAQTSDIMVGGIWSWYKFCEEGDKESAAFAAKSGSSELHSVLSCLCLPEEILRKVGAKVDIDTLRHQSISLLVLARPEIIPRISWIDLSLRMGVDPGLLVRERLDDCVNLINEAALVSYLDALMKLVLMMLEQREWVLPCNHPSGL